MHAVLTQQPEFNPQKPHSSGYRKTNPKSCPLAFPYVPWHMHTHTSPPTHNNNKQNFKTKKREHTCQIRKLREKGIGHVKSGTSIITLINSQGKLKLLTRGTI